MGRRKKEPKSVHRENIATAASSLFLKNGVSSTTMNDIAVAAGYSKATLYVYFENKEEIISFLVLDSMNKLCSYITDALQHEKSTRKCYDTICNGLVKYEAEFPYYFRVVLEKINIDFENTKYLPEEKETYEVGERIRKMMIDFLKSGIENGTLKDDLEIEPTFFSFWGMLAGVIQLASNKEKYIETTMGLTKTQFLLYSFDMLYSSIAKSNSEQDISEV